MLPVWLRGKCSPRSSSFLTGVLQVFKPESPDRTGQNRKRCTQSSHWDFDGSASCQYRRGDPRVDQMWIRVDFPHFTMAVWIGQLC